MAGPKHLESSTFNNGGFEPDDATAWYENRDRIDENLRLPGLTFPDDDLDTETWPWWRPL